MASTSRQGHNMPGASIPSAFTTHVKKSRPSNLQSPPTQQHSMFSRPCKRQRRSLSFKASEVGSEQSSQPVTAEVLQESTSLQLAEELSYRSIPLEGCELLIAATDDGRLDFSSVFVHDYDLDIFAEPERDGNLPETIQRYAEAEWVEEFLGDSLESKEPWRKVLKVYLVQVEQEEPFRLNLEQVYSMHAEERVFRKEEVLWLTEERDPRLITLRIRPEGLYIEENSEMMSEYHMSEEFLIEEEQARVAELKARNEEEVFVSDMGEDSSIARDPLDALNDDDREYDETMEDTPEVDQGF